MDFVVEWTGVCRIRYRQSLNRIERNRMVGAPICLFLFCIIRGFRATRFRRFSVHLLLPVRRWTILSVAACESYSRSIFNPQRQDSDKCYIYMIYYIHKYVTLSRFIVTLTAEMYYKGMYRFVPLIIRYFMLLCCGLQATIFHRESFFFINGYPEVRWYKMTNHLRL